MNKLDNIRADGGAENGGESNLLCTLAVDVVHGDLATSLGLLYGWLLVVQHPHEHKKKRKEVK